MAPAFSVLRSSSRRRGGSRDDLNLDSRYGDAGISAPNQGASWGEWASPPISPEPEGLRTSARRSPRAENDTAKSSITITINLPWKTKSRSNSLPPTQSRFRQEPEHPAPVQAPLQTSPMVSPKYFPATNLAQSQSIPVRASPRPQSPPYFQEIARRSPKPQDLTSRSYRPKPATPLMGVLSPVSETFDERPRHGSLTSETISTQYPLPPRRSPLPSYREFDSCYDASDEETEHQYEPFYNPRSRSPTLESLRRSPRPVHPPRRARSVEPSMYHRRPISTSSSSSDSIESDVDSAAESGYGSYTSARRVDFSKPTPKRNVYNTTATDYSMIIREVEADYQAAKHTKTKRRPSDAKTPGSAGSGISMDSGYTSGPQVMVPSGEDLWG